MKDLFQYLSLRNFLESMPRLKAWSRPLLIVGLSLLVLFFGINAWAGLASRGQTQQQTTAPGGLPQAANLSPSSTPVPASASPFLFGGNLDLSSDQEPMLTSSSFPSLLQKLHVQIVRISADSSHTMVRSIAQMLNTLGITPLVVLFGSLDPDALTKDIDLVRTMNDVFRSGQTQQTVYYEFGNEEDALGASAAHYVSAWNSIIPRLKALAPQALFLGPANYRYNKAFLTTFLQQAKPRPDAISWHEYSCAGSWSKALCLSHISDWAQHIADARQTMQATLQSELPIMITEWNYAANANASDGKSNDSSFLTSWTTRAIQTLAASHVFAAMQYTITNGAASLIQNNHLTAQGEVFQQQYDTFVTKISFEDGGTGGFGKSNTMTDIQNSTDVALDGQHALKITISNSTSNDYPTLWFAGAPSATYPGIGQTIVAYIYVPPGSVPPVANVYVLDSNHQQCAACHYPGWSFWVTLTPGMWTRVSYTVAPGVSMPSSGFGISFTTTDPQAVNSTFYVDTFGWG